jgi:hypothetical protein
MPKRRRKRRIVAPKQVLIGDAFISVSNEFVLGLFEKRLESPYISYAE